MKFIKLTESVLQAVNDEARPLINGVESALDLIATVRYEYGDVHLVIRKEDVLEDFFDLKTRIAGEILQKFVNYNMAVAIVGDFSGYSSKSLKDFIYESNKGRSVFFVESTGLAIQMLEQKVGG